MAIVRDILEKKGFEVAAVEDTVTVLAASKIMSQRRIGSVVVKSADRIVGIFTERDVLNRVVADEKDVHKTLVKDVMSSPIACCQTTTKLAECKSIMSTKKLRHLPVVDHGKLTGMISIGDINAFESVEQAHTIEYLNEYLHGRT